MSRATRVLADEIDAALDRLDPARREREYRAQGEFLFQYRVSPSREGERRVVFREIGRARRLFSNLKDAFAYFGPRALRRSRPRGARVTA